MMRAEKREEESQCKTSNETREDDYRHLGSGPGRRVERNEAKA